MHRPCMKLLVLLGLVVLGGIALTIFAIQTQREEIGALEILSPAQETGEKPAVNTESKVAEPEPIPETSTPPNVTKNACLALEQQLQQELEDAERNLGRARKNYEDAEESYDDSLSVSDQDQQYLDQLSAEKEEAKDALEDAEGNYNGAQKRLSRARLECGLFQ